MGCVRRESVGGTSYNIGCVCVVCVWAGVLGVLTAAESGGEIAVVLNVQSALDWKSANVL